MVVALPIPDTDSIKLHECDPKTDTSVKREVDPDHKFINITANDYSRAVKKIIEENF